MTDTSNATETPVDVATPRKFRRSGNDKVVAGIARGLSNRFDVDANVFRVLFVVLAFVWGLGVAVYLALWVFVPRAQGEELETPHRSRLDESHSHRLSIALLAGVVVLAVMVTLFSLGRSLGHVGPGFLLLWLVFLISLAVVALRTPARRVTIRRFIAVVFLLIISVVILATGAFFGFLASTGVPLSGGNGVHVWQPNSPDAVRHEYTTEFGSENVDLAAVEFPSSGFRITASTAVGYLRVTVPSGAVVSVTTNVGMGTVQYGLNLSEGRPYAALPSPHLDAAQLRNAPHLALDARVGIGHIVILRASSRP